MNNLVNNNMLRLQYEMVLLRGEGISINELESFLDINKSIIYDDIIAFNNENYFSLGMKRPDASDEDDEKADIMANILDDKKTFKNDLNNGKYDDYIFFSISDEKTLELVLTAEEYDVLNDFMNNNSTSRAFQIKNSNMLRDYEIIDFVAYILDTIKEGGSISFIYHSKNTDQVKTIRPIKIIHNTTEDTYYIFDHKGKSYNIDRIQLDSIVESDAKQNIARNIDEKRFDKMWGVNYSEKGVKVKLKIFNEAKVIERVKCDLGKKLTDDNFTLYEDEGYAIFEDEVIGAETFLSWVYGYGSSMVLLEPKELVDKVIDSIKKRKEIYSK
ncbi:MAG: WYL domain-containing protein [Eubacterium sp.]|nr:WYL domain-containing protein [Eubacterium sp.]